ncbi:hypothetical protein BN1708_018098, partial [Verticillium longisporum]
MTSAAPGPSRPPNAPRTLTPKSVSDPVLRNALRYTISAREYATLHKYVISRSRVLRRTAPSVATVEKMVDGDKAGRRPSHATVKRDIARAQALLATEGETGIRAMAREIGADPVLLRQVAELGRLPVVNFAAGGVATPADAALMMQLGCDGVFVGSGIFKSGDPAKRARAIVRATTHYQDAAVLAECSTGLGEAMVGINCDTMKDSERLATRGW